MIYRMEKIGIILSNLENSYRTSNNIKRTGLLKMMTKLLVTKFAIICITIMMQFFVTSNMPVYINCIFCLGSYCYLCIFGGAGSLMISYLSVFMVIHLKISEENIITLIRAKDSQENDNYQSMVKYKLINFIKEYLQVKQ